MRSRLFHLFFTILFGTLHAEMRAPETTQGPPPSLPQIWETADAIVYGTAVRIEVDASVGDTIRYKSTLRVERCWKGDLKGDIRVEGGRFLGCYFDVPFRIRGTYLVLLKRQSGGDAYAPQEIQDFRLSPTGEPTPEPSPYAQQSLSLLGDTSPTQPSYNERAWEIFEFAQRMAGHETEAKRLRDLRMDPILERKRVAKEAAEKAKELAEFNAAVLRDFEAAQKTENLTQRKSLLLALKLRIKDRFDDGAQELKGKIIGELSVADTLLTNGVKTSPKSRP